MISIAGVTQVAQRAEDLDRATDFYRDVLGLRHIATFDPPGLVFFDLVDVRLLLERGAKPATLYLTVADIDIATDSLRERGVEIVTEPHNIFTDADGTFGDPDVEEWQAFFNDSEGNVVGLVERRQPT